MRSLVSAELLKLRSTRTAWIPLAVALGFAVIAVVASTVEPGHGSTAHLSPAALPGLLRGSGGQLLDGAVLLCWIVLSAGEFRHRTSVTTFLGEPNRLRVVSAKLIAAALGLALMWAFVIEGIIPAVTHQPGIIRWLPEAAANAVLHGASPPATTLSAGAALAVLAGYAAVLAGAGAALTARREIGTTTG